MLKGIRTVFMTMSLLFASISYATPTWDTTPAITDLPKAVHTGYAPVNGVRIWYAVYGKGQPVLLLHGGMADSNYWEKQVPELAKSYQVIVMDTRGHGRSTHDDKPYSYTLFTQDAIAVLDYLHIKKTAVVGWSDGAIVGLQLAMQFPERISGVFAYGANSDPAGTKDGMSTHVLQTYINEINPKEYQRVSPDPKGFAVFSKGIITMWETQPNFTAKDLKNIRIPVWIVDGDRDEGIRRENTEFMANNIPNSGLLILPEVGHFAHLQDPVLFNQAVLRFLKKLDA